MHTPTQDSLFHKLTKIAITRQKDTMENSSTQVEQHQLRSLENMAFHAGLSGSLVKSEESVFHLACRRGCLTHNYELVDTF